MDLSEFNADLVRPHTGTKFHARIDEQPVDLVLEKVSVVMERHADPRLSRDSFSMLFSGPKDIYIKQGTFEISHDELGGPWLIFIVPIGREPDGSFRFEAAFT